ncbi:hypothetical protein [Polaromonas sp.]|uniref:hypothetical protein n=1 Tax=Polaromonas sp. TaxID=1869339 RepID=UPI0017E5F6CE|nr:hypothetical protein [Polaromonas sp.]NMM07226.1 hypothetical protein [Polaromonas sp.]
MNSLEMTGYLAAEQAPMRPNFSGSAQQIYFNYKTARVPISVAQAAIEIIAITLCWAC